MNVPIQCGGVAVHPGDLVVADDGVVIVLLGRLDDVFAAAETALARQPLAGHGSSMASCSARSPGLEVDEIIARLQERGWT